MKIKDGVIMTGLQVQMRQALMIADGIYTSYGKELVVTSAIEGEHSAGSLHFYGYALDFRTYYFTDKEKLEVYGLLCDKLAHFYDVLLEKDHFHIEYKIIN